MNLSDLAIYDDRLKVGFGLLNYKGAEFAMEIALLVIGIALYLKRNAIKSAWRKIGIVVFGVVLILVQTQTTFWGRPLSSIVLSQSRRSLPRLRLCWRNKGEPTSDGKWRWSRCFDRSARGRANRWGS
jgi:hypothetical protein